MKKLILTGILLVFTVFKTFSQAPQSMSYQAVIRNSSNDLITNKMVGLKLSILKGSSAGTVVYSETHNPTSNNNGLVTLQVGSGTPNLNKIDSIDWSTGVYYLKTEVDINGGTNYSLSSVTQFLSVPYSNYSTTAGKLSDYAMYEEQYSNTTSLPKLNVGLSNNYVSNVHKFNKIIAQKGTNINLNSFSGSITLKPGIYKIEVSTPLKGIYNSTTMSYLSFTGTLSNNINSYNETLYNENIVQNLISFLVVTETETFTLNQYINNNNGYTSVNSTDPVPGTNFTTVAKIIIQKM
jgi:hypothetical protein